MVKTCFKCGATKPIDEFYKHSRMADGRLNKCKPCARADVAANRAQSLERYRAYDRVRYYAFGHRSAPSKEAVAKAAKRARARGRDRVRARQAVADAVAAGRLARPAACEQCGAHASGRALHAHHHDYAKPLDVTWLCRTCHYAEHRKYTVSADEVAAYIARKAR